MKIDQQTGLVLEGGGMRGVFTCGVLDYLLDKKMYFSYAVGVSAGACNGLSYMSRQRGRAKFSNIDMLEKYQYIGMKFLWTQRSILDMQLLYNDFPEKILPYDYEAYFRNPATFEMVTTNCLTGQACYLTDKVDKERALAIAKASSSLPFVCPIAPVDGVPMLDGGIVDSIPLARAQNTGHKRNVVVLTRNFGYRDRDRDIRIPHFIYRNYPRLRVVLSHRLSLYNRQLEMVEKAEREDDDTLVIRPLRPMQVTRLEKDVKRLTDLYEEGYECAQKVLEKADICL